ncbi:DEAD/DEAH box helicase [bacterium C-53]|nr:DEAD/DEAH box helicase [Lachnospiraceae bacterium]NBI03355.1 DEAD/DEAH box helicase [Lachnospiraceae bacterium]RKJ09933.1 DEAD/DEAH box helicase [bacterium C-53]
MKLKFKQQDFQTVAVNAVCALFDGQQRHTATFSMVQNSGQTELFETVGICNTLYIDEQKMIENMWAVQRKNHLPLTNSLKGRQFSIEMETGTGKTYAYTKTIYELNRLYNFTKFIVVVPSVAIREGVYKSLQTTEEHFSSLYDNVPCRYFIYNSAKLSDVRQFATGVNIEIMIINIDAFRKAENVIHQQQEKLNGDAAISYIQATNPIVIIDEPQSVDNTQKAKDAVASLNPLCVFRYSATHREKINLLYRLTPVDAYQMGLVKQICVSSNQTVGGFNRPYVRLLSVSNDNGFRARVQIDIEGKDGKVSRKNINVKQGSDLYRLSGNRNLYDGYVITGIDCTPSMERIEIANTEVVRLGKAIGEIDETIIKRMQIRRTIETHLDKELRYTEKGIKVLSLFFIDEVRKYRAQDGGKGVYEQIFEELYIELINLPKYVSLKAFFPANVECVHDGYFSQDKKGNFKNTKGDTLDDYDTYNAIMKDKEWLLSFDCPLRFIFSHSALKEGWDNPNVFQVCALNEQKSTLTVRQKVGRGLRLCVNQNGERIEDRNVNLLHVMANESFSEFVNTLQKEIEVETGTEFGVLQLDLFKGIIFEEKQTEEKPLNEEQVEALLLNLANEGFIKPKTTVPKVIPELPKELEAAKEKAIEVIAYEGDITPEAIIELTAQETVVVQTTLTYDDAQQLMTHFEEKGYITKSGKIKDSLKKDIQEKTLNLPPRFESARQQVVEIICKANEKLPVWDASRDVAVHLKKEVIVSPEFLELWDKIKQKTSYCVQINDDEMIWRSVEALKKMESIPKARIVTQTADIQINNPGITYTERGIRAMDFADSYTSLPDILAIIGAQTLTKRSTIFEILKQSGRLDDFLNNPQMFIENVIQIIQDVRHALAINGISYKKLFGEEYYVQEIFDSTELIANLDRNAVAVDHSVYDYILYDSTTIEKPFALALDNDPDVKMFFKLPGRFKVDTPIGTYNPDWAVYVETEEMKKMYFVLETKGSMSLSDLRESEKMKIYCGKAHFKEIDTGVELCGPIKDWNSFKIKNI